MKLRCKGKGCRKTLIFKDGSLDKERRIVCSQCGYENRIEKKKNGKIRIS